MQHQFDDSSPSLLEVILNGPPPKSFRSAAKMSNDELKHKLEGADVYVWKRHIKDVAYARELCSPESQQRAINKANEDQDACFLWTEDMELEFSLCKCGGMCWERDQTNPLHVDIVEYEEPVEGEEDSTAPSGPNNYRGGGGVGDGVMGEQGHHLDDDLQTTAAPGRRTSSSAFMDLFITNLTFKLV